MESKILRIRTTVNDLRNVWMFDNDTAKVRLAKFKEVKILMQDFYELTRPEKEVTEEDEIKRVA